MAKIVGTSRETIVREASLLLSRVSLTRAWRTATARMATGMQRNESSSRYRDGWKTKHPSWKMRNSFRARRVRNRSQLSATQPRNVSFLGQEARITGSDNKLTRNAVTAYVTGLVSDDPGSNLYLHSPSLFFHAESAVREATSPVCRRGNCRWPAITVLVAAHNEEAVVADILKALLEVDYPGSG